ncbi:hypothetical protein ES703_12048 [subsurface metagenome]
MTDLITFKSLDVGLGKDLIQVLIAYAPGRVSAASFFHSQNSELDAEMVEDSCHRLCDFFVAVIIGSNASHEEQEIDFFSWNFREDGDVQLLHPVSPGVTPHTPWIRVVFQAFEGCGQFFRKLAFHEHLIPPHVQDLVHMFDVDRTVVHTGTACCAGPEFIFLNDVSHKRRSVFQIIPFRLGFDELRSSQRHMVL